LIELGVAVTGNSQIVVDGEEERTHGSADVDDVRAAIRERAVGARRGHCHINLRGKAKGPA